MKSYANNELHTIFGGGIPGGPPNGGGCPIMFGGGPIGPPGGIIPGGGPNGGGPPIIPGGGPPIMPGGGGPMGPQLLSKFGPLLGPNPLGPPRPRKKPLPLIGGPPGP